jgi:hypothetical protein
VQRQLKSGDLLDTPSGRGQRTQFLRELRLIVRQRDDQGEKRNANTACAREIKENISCLLDKWSSRLRGEVVKELAILRDKHAVCMSDL